MPIDPSIVLGIRPAQIQPPRDPMERYGKSLALKNLMQQGEIQQRGIEDENAVRDAYRQAGGDSKALRALLQGQGQYKQIQALDKADLENEAKRAAIGKDTAAAGKSKFDVAIGEVQHGSAILQVAKDNPQAWPAVRKVMALNFPNLANQLPEQYDPQFIDAKIAAGQTITQRLTDQRAREQQAETGRHNRAGEANQAGQLAVSQGNLTETRRNNQRPVYDTERGGFASRPDAAGTSTFTPVTGAPPGQKQIIATREDTDKLRQEFEGKPTVKNYRDVIPIAAAGKSAPDTRAGDIQMAYAVGKILDPNSVVREGELKLVGDAATVMGKIEGELRTVAMGKGRLTSETRAQLNDMLANAVAQRKSSYDAERKSYEGIVGRRGYKPEDVFIETPKPAVAAPAAPSRAEIDAELRRRKVIP